MRMRSIKCLVTLITRRHLFLFTKRLPSIHLGRRIPACFLSKRPCLFIILCKISFVPLAWLFEITWTKVITRTKSIGALSKKISFLLLLLCLKWRESNFNIDSLMHWCFIDLIIEKTLQTIESNYWQSIRRNILSINSCFKNHFFAFMTKHIEICQSYWTLNGRFCELSKSSRYGTSSSDWNQKSLAICT